MSQTPFLTLFALYPGMTQLDFTGPYRFLKRRAQAQNATDHLTTLN